MNRLRHQIIDLKTGKVYMNESMIEKELGISRYYIHKSLKDHIPVKGYMFAYYSYGMNIEDIKTLYMSNANNQIMRSKKWQNLTKLTGRSSTLI